MDRENVIEGLENLRETIRTATQYTFTSGGICAMSMKRIDNALALLKEQPEIVRCENCKHHGKGTCSAGAGIAFPTPDDWFCADGERKTE